MTGKKMYLMSGSVTLREPIIIIDCDRLSCPTWKIEKNERRHGFVFNGAIDDEGQQYRLNTVRDTTYFVI